MKLRCIILVAALLCLGSHSFANASCHTDDICQFDKTTMIKERLKMAQTCIDKKDYSAAKGYLNGVLKLDPNNAKAKGLLAVCNKNVGTETTSQNSNVEQKNNNAKGYVTSQSAPSLYLEKPHADEAPTQESVAIADYDLYPSDIVEQSSDVNFIYLFDCTSSMLGVRPNKLTKNLFRQDNLYTRTKRQLRNSILQITDGETHITIIPFAEKPGEAISFLRSEFAWEDVEARLDDMVWHSHNTGIAKALEYSDLFFEKDKTNFLFLYTDGDDNVDRCGGVVKYIQSWCQSHRDDYGFYVALTEEAIKCKELFDAIRQCPNMQCVQGEQVVPFGVFRDTMVDLNVHVMPDEVAVRFTALGSYAATVESSTPYFDVSIKENVISNGRMVLQFHPKYDDIEGVLPRDPYMFDVVIYPQNNSLNIINQTIHVLVSKGDVPNLSVCNDKSYAGMAFTYNSFLVLDAKRSDTICIDLKGKSPRDLCGKTSTFKIRASSDDMSGYTLLYNGKHVKNNTFSVGPYDDKMVLSVVVDDRNSTGKKTLKLEGVDERLSTINGTPTRRYKNTFSLHHIHMPNPIISGLVVLGIVVLAVL